MTHPYLDIHPDVAAALAANRPVVALESTIISHGMPYPQNVATALRVEAEVRAHGATPATVAIIHGRLKAGLTQEDIEHLGQSGRSVVKVSRRDIPFIVASGATGATTVASTMIIAAMAGITVFATGGIGGVHRGAELSFDISADLQELAITPVAVVCAGAKSILDLRLTLEYLETHGVPVVGYQTASLPAFFTRDSEFKVDYRLDTAAEIAQAMHAKWAMGLRGGMVIANPIPHAFAMPRSSIDPAIEQALSEAKAQGIEGKESTPFLLARVCELTGGDSLASNIQLVLNNARLAAEIALEYAALKPLAA
jgi:pseudouridylate synthase